MSFAPYQPPPQPGRSNSNYSGGYQQLPGGSGSVGGGGSSSAAPQSFNGGSAYVTPGAVEQGGERINKYETQLPVRVDIEAALCYSLMALSAVVFLIFETKNDYVRYHAWQSALTFTVLIAAQIIFSFISSALAWIVFIIELGAVGWLGYNAYINGDSLDRYEVPYIGKIASQWVDSE
ncbi:hypothetical protein HK097_008162 [Rhizophlyctis rosea]|uniref:Uncharacterized protein n=1 Tax=Rhizophlyctis rosea TaxID=64517 RepID=A0AAD5X1V0_9FUNG|nr:hypothetical protein HK097_008162 [Rhizophlyctis rosea]